MKKNRLLFGLIVLCVLLSGCSKKTEVKESAGNSQASETANETVKEAIENIILSEKESENQSVESEEAAETEDAESDETAEKKDKYILVEVGILNGPSGLPFLNQMKNKNLLNGYKLTYDTYAEPSLVIPQLVKNEVQITVLPPNVAAKIYNKNNGAIVMTAVCGNGMLSLITRNKEITSFADLKGQTVYVAGSGATPEYIARYLLKQNEIEAGEGEEKVNLDFTIPTAALVSSIIEGKIQNVIIPEPFATSIKQKLNNECSVINIQSEYAKFQKEAKNFPMSVIVVNKEFAKENYDFVKKFMKEYQKTLEWTVANPIKTALNAEEENFSLKKEVIIKAVPNCAFTYIPAKKAKKDIEALLEIFLQNEETSIGGTLPDEGFYFK